MNAIYLRGRSKVILPDDTGAKPLNVLASLQKNPKFARPDVQNIEQPPQLPA
jgi:hypothetical protein